MAKKITESIGKKVQILQDPMPKKDMAAEILTSLRQISPEEQNAVIEKVLQEIALDRQNSYDAAQDTYRRAGENLERFFRLQHAGEVAIKERDAALQKGY